MSVALYVIITLCRCNSLYCNSSMSVALYAIVTLCRCNSLYHNSSMSVALYTIITMCCCCCRVYFNSVHQHRELYKQTNKTSLSLTDLHAYTNYYIRVVAYNSQGQGMPTEDEIVRTFSDSKCS